MGCFRGDGLRLGYVRVGGPCQAPNVYTYYVDDNVSFTNSFVDWLGFCLVWFIFGLVQAPNYNTGCG